MTRRACGIVIALLFLSITVPVLGKNYSLYSPKLWSPQEKEQIEKEQKPLKKKKRQVKKAKVPGLKQKTTAKPAAQPIRGRSLSDVKQPDVGKNEISAPIEQSQPPQPAENAIIKPPTALATPVPAKTGVQQSQAYSNITTPGHNLFEQAVKSYRQDDCQTAIQLFGRFLAENTKSELAADVSVFIADCYQKLSGK